MKTEKAVYTAPKAKCFEVKVQGVFCQSYGQNGAPGQSLGLNEDNNNYGSF